MNEADKERRMAAEMPKDDVVAILLRQHARIRDLFTEVRKAQGQAKRQAFEELRALLAVHETAEEMIVRPVAKETAGKKEADARNQEEKEANKVLAHLEKMDVADPRFDVQLADFERSVIEHATHEEREEFPRCAAGGARISSGTWAGGSGRPRRSPPRARIRWSRARRWRSGPWAPSRRWSTVRGTRSPAAGHRAADLARSPGDTSPGGTGAARHGVRAPRIPDAMGSRTLSRPAFTVCTPAPGGSARGGHGTATAPGPVSASPHGAVPAVPARVRRRPALRVFYRGCFIGK